MEPRLGACVGAEEGRIVPDFSSWMERLASSGAGVGRGKESTLMYMS